MAEITLGTAQFGLTYGIANQTGKIDLDAGREILALAKQQGVHTLDTAIAYGDAESMLGELGSSSWKVITKLPPLPHAISDVAVWVETQVALSIARLKTGSLYGLLLHNPVDLLGPHSETLINSLLKLKSHGLVLKLGISIYSSDELDQLVKFPIIDLVQTPMNIIDRGLANSGWLSKLADNEVEIHTRSTFLQGLLTMSPASRPDWSNKWAPIFSAWDAWVTDSGMSRIQACLAHIQTYPEIDQIVVGVDSAEQFLEVLESLKTTPLRAPSFLESGDPQLINPTNWVNE